LVIPYSNAPIERSFDHLKITKNVRRLNLKEENVQNLMIVRQSITRKRVDEFSDILDQKLLKRVKKTIEEKTKEKNEAAQKKMKEELIKVNDFAIKDLHKP
jgi:hypothetical protein